MPHEPLSFKRWKQAIQHQLHNTPKPAAHRPGPTLRNKALNTHSLLHTHNDLHYIYMYSPHHVWVPPSVSTKSRTTINTVNIVLGFTWSLRFRLVPIEGSLLPQGLCPYQTCKSVIVNSLITFLVYENSWQTIQNSKSPDCLHSHPGHTVHHSSASAVTTMTLSYFKKRLWIP